MVTSEAGGPGTGEGVPPRRNAGLSARLSRAGWPRFRVGEPLARVTAPLPCGTGVRMDRVDRPRKSPVVTPAGGAGPNPQDRCSERAPWGGWRSMCPEKDVPMREEVEKQLGRILASKT